MSKRMTKNDKKQIVATAHERFGNTAKKRDIETVVREFGYNTISPYFLNSYKISHGVYNLASMAIDLGIDTAASTADFNTKSESEKETKPASIVQNIVPKKDKNFVETKNAKMLRSILRSGKFYPVFITGLSGNGKSLSVVQSAAAENRELIRINVTAGTDDTDLIGSFRLENGETVWADGPIITAMKRGAVVLIDELDMLHPNKAAELFTALEGNGVYIKKTNTYVMPEPGFNIIATANTKGKGSNDGRFMGTNVLNEAFLERFPITLEFEYPTKGHERKILSRVFEELEITDDEFRKHLVDWAAIIRKTFDDGAIDETMSTRRLVHIANAYAIFGDRRQSIELCINRFDDETKESFLSLYEKLDDNLVEVDDDGNMVEKAETAYDNSNVAPAF